MGYIGHTPNWTAPTAAPPISGADITDDSLESVKIKAGTIVDSDINASAAIVTSKVSGAVTAIASHGLATSATTDTTNADNIGSGTLPDARFPATLPAKSGVNLTALNATQLTSGTLPDARFGALPAVSGANLTSLTAGNITGVVPAANLGTGTANSGTFLNGSGAYSEAGGGAWTVLKSTTASNVAAVDFVHGTGGVVIDSTYSTYVFVGSELLLNGGGGIDLLISNNTGGSWDTSGYNWTVQKLDNNSYSGTYSDSDSSLHLSAGHEVATDNIAGFEVYMKFPANSSYKKIFKWDYYGMDTGDTSIMCIGTGGHSSNGIIDGVRFLAANGASAITSGRITLYGIAHA